MNNSTPRNYYSFFILIMGFLFLTNNVSSQIKKSFSPRFSENVNGDVTIIANNMLSRHKTDAYNGSDGNHDFTDNVFVDIDNDNNTFNSSSANFSNPVPTITCLNFKKVYLYWAAADKEYGNDSGNGGIENNWNYNQVRLMLPGSNSYQTITADETSANFYKEL